MRQKNLLLSFMVAVFCLFSGNIAKAELLLQEDFNYTVGAKLTDNGWTAHSGAGTSSISVVSPGLVFNGYAGSNIGYAAGVTKNGEDVNKTFTAQTTGTVYAAFIIKTSSTSSNGYFLHLGASPLSSQFSRVWVNSTGTGIGIGTDSPTTGNWINVTPDVPTLVVLKQEISTKISSLYVFDTYPTAEPAEADTTFTETANYTNVGSIGLRQFNNNQNIIVDGIRIATTWAEAVAAGVADVTPPVWTEDYPKTANAAKTSVDLIVNMNEAGTAYYLVLTDEETAPTVEEVVANNKEIVIATANTDYTKTIEELTGATAYDIYVVAKDAAGNLQTAPVKIDVTTAASSNEAEILTYSLAGQISSEINNGAINVLMPSKADLTSVIATFTLSEGATAKVEGVDQGSGISANDFTNPVVYTITAEDGTTTEEWTVTATLVSTETTLSSTVYTINNNNNTITDIPVNTTLAVFKTNLTPAEHATFEVYEAASITPAATLETGCRVIVTAQDGTTERMYTITVNDVQPTGDLFISEYIEGSSNNKAVEIYNGTGVTLDLASYTVKVAANGNEWNEGVVLSGILEDKAVYVIANPQANDKIKEVADTLNLNGTAYNGDDAVGLFNNGVLIDAIGTQGVRPTGGWDVAGVTKAALDHTLIRKASVTTGNTDWATSAGTTTEDSEWIVYPKDYSGGLGSHNQPLPNYEAEVLTYSLPNQTGNSKIAGDSIKVTMPANTDVTALIATFTLSEGATAKVGETAQESEVTSNDFTNPVVYTVTAEDGTTKNWKVLVTILTPNAEAEIITYSLPGQVGDTQINDSTISVTMPADADVTALIATFTLSEGATAKVGETAQESEVTENDFTSPVVYTVTAEDGTTTKNWTVTVTKATVGLDNNLDAQLSVYPNPFKDVIYFDNTDIKQITVTNTLGQRIFSVQPTANSINTSNLESGIYLISFQNTEGKVATKRLIKE